MNTLPDKLYLNMNQWPKLLHTNGHPLYEKNYNIPKQRIQNFVNAGTRFKPIIISLCENNVTTASPYALFNKQKTRVYIHNPMFKVSTDYHLEKSGRSTIAVGYEMELWLRSRILTSSGRGKACLGTSVSPLKARETRPETSFSWSARPLSLTRSRTRLRVYDAICWRTTGPVCSQITLTSPYE